MIVCAVIMLINWPAGAVARYCDEYVQGRSHRGGYGGHGGRVPLAPRAPYYVPLHQNDNRQFVFGADFWRVTWRYTTAYN